jgi:hypothetical protein
LEGPRMQREELQGVQPEREQEPRFELQARMLMPARGKARQFELQGRILTSREREERLCARRAPMLTSVPGASE